MHEAVSLALDIDVTSFITGLAFLCGMSASVSLSLSLSLSLPLSLSLSLRLCFCLEGACGGVFWTPPQLT